MNDKCPFKQGGRCDIWLDYQVNLIALNEAEKVASENWKEILYLLDRIQLLECTLKNAGIPVPKS